MTARSLIAAALAAMLVGACSGESPTPTPGTGPVPTPDVEATVVAEIQARLPRPGPPIPAPAPASEEEKHAIGTFAVDHSEIVQTWADLHSDFNTWRAGLRACEPGSARMALQRFASNMGAVSDEARKLPRDPVVRALGDKLIVAAETEAAALRRLRDAWQPDDATSFQELDARRATSSALRGEAQDALGDLQAQTTIAFRARIAAYEQAFKDISNDWDEFRQAWDSFRAEQVDLGSSEVVATLGHLVDEFRRIVVAVRDLPTGDATRAVTDTLAEAAEAEDLALRRLRGTFSRSDSPSTIRAAAPATTDGSAQSQTQGAIVASDPTLFDTFDTQLATGNAARRHAAQMMADLLGRATTASRAAAQRFAQELELVLVGWDRLHDDYDEWRRDDGGCDRLAAVGALQGFTSDLTALVRRARELPGGSNLTALRELLVEAAEHEEEGLRDLRNGWRPFDVAVYGEFESRQRSAAGLRRQVATGLDALLEAKGIPAP